MIRTNVIGIGDVVVTKGMLTSDGSRIYGVFANEADASAENADDLFIAIVGPERLSTEVIVALDAE